VSSNPWDFVRLAGISSPGVARVDVSMPSDIDEQKPKGVKRGYIVDNGDGLIKFDVELVIQPGELDVLTADFLPQLRSKNKSGGKSPATFEHPMAALVNVSNVVVSDIDIPMPNSGGVMVVKFKLIEWVKKPAKVKVKVKPQNVTGDGRQSFISDQIPEPDADNAFLQGII
jgi:hypothetical protein